ncbi:MAG: ubiH [Gammaproteobacteria bacterium]|jgi:2-octaprenyl-6-methoxyphenol hydroxylase|nr:ubiH [Gammaproteobacteria bacterium]
MKFDIIIIGGGMVGATLACALTLSKKSWRVALVDAAEEKKEDARLIALNEGSCCFLKNLGIWPLLIPYAAPIQQIHVSHRGHFGIARITAHELGLTTLGHVIPASSINAALFTTLKNSKNITLIRPATLNTIMQNPDTVAISIDTAQGKQEHTADILIGADGHRSTVRELIEMPTHTIDYQQSALVTVTELARPHHYIAYERFQEKGAIAMLPLIGMHAATIWTAPRDYITDLMQLNNEEFLHQLQQQFGYRLGRMQKTGKRTVYPLQMQQAHQQKKQNVLLIGNAARTLHPIAAQGLNLALYEVATLLDYFSTQTSLKRCLENLPVHSLQHKFSQSLSHSLTELFSKKVFPLNIARPMGLVGFDQCIPLKRKFTHYAMGKSGHTPSLFLNKTE